MVDAGLLETLGKFGPISLIVGLFLLVIPKLLQLAFPILQKGQIYNLFRLLIYVGGALAFTGMGAFVVSNFLSKDAHSGNQPETKASVSATAGGNLTGVIAGGNLTANTIIINIPTDSDRKLAPDMGRNSPKKAVCDANDKVIKEIQDKGLFHLLDISMSNVHGYSYNDPNQAPKIVKNFSKVINSLSQDAINSLDQKLLNDAKSEEHEGDIGSMQRARDKFRALFELHFDKCILEG